MRCGDLLNRGQSHTSHSEDIGLVCNVNILLSIFRNVLDSVFKAKLKFAFT